MYYQLVLVALKLRTRSLGSQGGGDSFSLNILDNKQ